MNETEPIPNRTTKRRRSPGILVPNSVPAGNLGQRQLSPEEWQEHQNKLQAQHARGFVQSRDREIEQTRATNKQRRQTAEAGHSLAGPDVMMEAENILPVPRKVVAGRTKNQPVTMPARGPVIDDENTVIDEGQVPIKKNRSKKVSKVAEARKRARLARVLG